jgi:phosphoglycolate phosphatase
LGLITLDDLVMFDFDGVIADSLEITHRATVAALEQHGFDHLVSEDVVLRLVESNWFEAFRRMGAPSSVACAVDEMVAADVRAGEMRPYDDVPEVIARLANRHRVLIVTSNRSDIVEEFLSNWSIAGIDEILGGDKGESKVPKLQKAVERYPHDDAWFVGDSVGDVEEGRAAGVTTVAVAWGWHSRQQLLQSRPDHIAHTPMELLQLLL